MEVLKNLERCLQHAHLRFMKGRDFKDRTLNGICGGASCMPSKLSVLISRQVEPFSIPWAPFAIPFSFLDALILAQVNIHAGDSRIPARKPRSFPACSCWPEQGVLPFPAQSAVTVTIPRR